MKKISYEGKGLAYDRSGSGRQTPVVLLHGFCEDHRMWSEWIPFLPARPYLCIDLPGFGQSDPVVPVSMEYMADAVAAVLDHLKIDTCLLVGHSMGGYVSLAFAARHPGRLAALCLFHSHPFADTPERKEARLKSVSFIEQNGHILYVRHMIPQLFSYDYSKGYPAEVNRLIHHASQFAPAAITAALHAMRNRPDRSSVLRDLACPVLLLIGKLDTAVPFEQSLEMTGLPRQASVEIFNSVGHMGMFTAARETAKAFREFLQQFGL
ncbi:MAG: hypothetical protein RLY31_1758 [Bacteroidota bacterium]|jgi:pimeloyl-ACP methyl ester carboxylesterase